jgi:hypothetical protein
MLLIIAVSLLDPDDNLIRMAFDDSDGVSARADVRIKIYDNIRMSLKAFMANFF